MSYITDKFDARVASILKRGGVGLMPSDTVYGLSCLALDESAVEKLHKLKDRSSHKPFIILISLYEMLNSLSINPNQAEKVKNYWPGPLTAILEAPKSPHWLNRGLGSLAIRMPDKMELTSLIDECGPLISTSANLQGQPVLNSAKAAMDVFGEDLDFYIDIGEIKDKQPSTIVRIDEGKLRVVRPGAVKID